MKAIRNTVFVPELAEKEGSEKMKTGTTTLGLICKDCVILAADRRMTAGTMIVGKKTEKVLPVTKHIGVTTAGSVSDIQLLYRYLSAELKLKEMRDGREPFVKEASNLLSRWVYSLIRSSYGVAHFLVGGYDSQPHLYDVYPDGSIMEHDEFIVSGSGSVYALGVLENKYKAGLKEEDGIKLAVEAINAALARDSASGNGIDVYVFDKGGAKKVFAKEVLSTVSA